MQPKDLPDISLPEGYEETIGSQEEILERARQEAIVQRRVIELRKQGQWSQRRLPKVWFAVFYTIFCQDYTQVVMKLIVQLS